MHHLGRVVQEKKNLKLRGVNGTIVVLAEGANRLQHRGFFDHKSAQAHWGGGGFSDHSSQYPGWSFTDYLNRALDLAESACSKGSIRGYITAQGYIVRYDAKTNDFVKAHPMYGLSTMFKPSRGTSYYEEQRKKEEYK